MAYAVDPTNINSPINADGAKQGAEEFRALKGYISTLVGGGGFPGVNVFRKNAIIGGDFDTNPWQRGTNFIGVAHLTYTADRWKYFKVGTVVQDIARTVDTPVFGTVYKNKTMDLQVSNCFQVNVTTADAAVAAGDLNYVATFIEGYDYKVLSKVPMVLGFWHKHTKTGIYCLGFQNFNNGLSYVAEYSQVVTDVWEFDSVLIPADMSASWSYINGIGLEVIFTMMAGSTFQTTGGVWAGGNHFATINQVNSVDTIGNKFRIANVQLEPGTLPSKFEQRFFCDELELCQRYYEKTFPLITAPATGAGTPGALYMLAPIITANANALRWGFATRKRTAPTIVTYNTVSANANWRDITAAADRTAGIGFTTEHATNIIMAGAPVVGNDNVIHATADAEF